MASSSFFIQRSEDARRHVNQLVKGLKQVAVGSLLGGIGCGVMAVLLGRFLGPEVQDSFGVAFVVWFLAAAFLLFACLYFVTARGLSRQKTWARPTGIATFLGKVLLCVWLGRRSAGAMIVFLLIASWDIYGLWVLLSTETGQLFRSSQASVKPANLVT